MIDVSWRHFSELTVDELYHILILRSAVFVVEQKCIYLDPDGNDINASHLMLKKDNRIVAYLRLFPPTLTQSFALFGRVATAPDVRKQGLGKLLLDELIAFAKFNYREFPLECSAQVYLRKFYESYGFQAIGDEYDEDGIPHIHMRREAEWS